MDKKTRLLLLTALFPAMMAVTSMISIPLGFLPPLTLQTLFVYLAALLLPKEYAFLSIAIYLILGAIGLPVFSNFTGGISAFLSHSGGFLLSFPIIAYSIGYMLKIGNSKNNKTTIFLILCINTIILYLLGALFISLIYNILYFPLLMSFVIYLPGDILKIILVIYISNRVNTQLYMSGCKYE